MVRPRDDLKAPRGPRSAQAPSAAEPPSARARATAAAMAGSKAAAAEAEKAESSAFLCFSQEEHARSKAMMGGAMHRVAHPALQGLYADGERLSLHKIEADHTPALLKIVDEVLTNATDHFRQHVRSAAADRVRQISLAFTPATGEIEVFNDGPGLPIVLHAQATDKAKRPTWTPEVAFGQVFAGTNLEKGSGCVKGGINGVGAKLANLHSREFRVETVRNGKTYSQRWRNEMRERGEPELGEVAAGAPKGYTRVTFVPDYQKLGYAPPERGGAPLSPADADDFSAWCRWRAAMAAAYVGAAATVRYNGAVLPTTSAASLARLVAAAAPGGGDAVLYPLPVKARAPPYADHPWDVAVALLPELPGGGRARPPPCAHISVINGVCCSKGPHVAWLKKLIGEAVAKKVAKATRAKAAALGADVASRGLVLAFAAPIPGADWEGQKKDELQLSSRALAAFAAAPAPLERLAAELAERHLGASERKKPPRPSLGAIAKYSGARLAGTAGKAGCRLLLAEGDSALSFLRSLLGEGRRCGGPTTEKHGTFSLGGVPMNAVRETWWEGAPAAPRLRLSERLREHQKFQDLNAVLGLAFGQTYRTPEDRARLRYGGVVVCTDQDLDGTGKILPLVLAYFWRFWPELLEAGYLWRLATPVLRVYPPRGPPREFHYQAAYDEWLAEAGAAALRGCRVKYYKGLGSHSAAEVAAMARTFEADLQAFELDPGAGALFEGYYAPPTDFRKRALARLVAFPSAAEEAASRSARRLTCSRLLDVDALAYKQDTLQRNLPGLDGLSVSRRKILAGAFLHFGAHAREVRVYQLGGSVAQRMCYHHGDASLTGTITQMAQRFPGALRYPLLVGVGQFGSRHLGGKDAASARYIGVSLAPWARAAYPAADDSLLPHVQEDGERAQPVCYAPVLPTVLLETYASIAEGWAVSVVARDLGQVVDLVRAYLEGDADVAAAVAGGAEALAALRARFPLAPSLEGYGEGLSPGDRDLLLRTYRGRLCSFGHYENLVGGAGRTLRVLELPMGLSTAAFLEDLQKKERPRLLAHVEDKSYGPHVDVALALAPGAWEELLAHYGDEGLDPVEDCFRLWRPLETQLNLHTPDGCMQAFGDDYHAVFCAWAPLRRELYGERLRREAVLLELRLGLERESLRFLEEGPPLGGVADEQRACQLLAERGYPALDASFLAAPGHTPTGQLRAAAEGPGASHEYLLSLCERDRVRANRDRRASKVRAKESRLAEVGQLLAERPFAGASVWRAEVSKALAAVEQGRQNGWWAAAKGR